jgi:nicotinate phosphoribosyltransferase
MSNTHLRSAYGQHLGLMTDLYQLTMAYGYWKTGLYHKKAIFHHFYRKPPFGGAYITAAGLALAIDYLQQLSFSTQDIQYLGSLKGANNKPLFDESFLNHLQRLQFCCSVDAVPEGSVVFPHHPIVRVEGPLLQCQLVETALLSLINFSSLIATKAARITQAAKDDAVLEFGFRRAQGFDGAITASRAAYIGGCHATSNVMAGRLYGIPVKGTHAHSWVMCFDDELDSFLAYADSMPNNCIFLVDTYDTIEGVKNAIIAGQKLKERGHRMLGIRLDSGDLAALSKAARKMLDEAGFTDAQVVASNDLDEYRIKALKDDGATITVWGVGTRLATAYDQPALGGVYKLGAIENDDGNYDYRMKKSNQAIKISNPGCLQTHRIVDEHNAPVADIIYDVHDGFPTNKLWRYDTQQFMELNASTGSDQLIPVFKEGKLVYNCPPLEQVRRYAKAQQGLFQNTVHYPFGLSAPLYDRKNTLISKL